VLAGVLVRVDRADAQNARNHEPPAVPVKLVSPLPLPVSVGVVSVKNLGEQRRTPYFVSLHCESQNSNGCSASAAAIPVGQRLVIEHVNATMQLRNPNTVQNFLLTVDNSIRADMPVVMGWNSGVHTNFTLNEPALIFAEEGQVPGLSFSAANIDVNATVRLSGYLIEIAE
jgi:hypothetical protein